MKIPMVINKIQGFAVGGSTTITYELSSRDEKYSARLVLSVNRLYKPHWEVDDQILIDVPEQSEKQPPTPQRLREVSG